MTANFTIKEFKDTGFPFDYSFKEMYMLKCLVNTLQCFRDMIGTSINVTGSYRTSMKTLELLSRGYFPSETSDHYFGQRIPVRNPEKISRYGQYFDLSTGAIDFTCVDIENNFKKMVQASKAGEVKIGQLILESSDKKIWIHVSNCPKLIYGEALASLIPQRKKYLYSLDGGRTYINYEA